MVVKNLFRKRKLVFCVLCVLAGYLKSRSLSFTQMWPKDFASVSVVDFQAFHDEYQ